MDYSITAKELIAKLGGKENINSLTHCMTRLRFVINDESKINDKVIEKIPGVMGIMKKSGQYQVIIGNNVSKCFAEINKIHQFSDTTTGKKVKQNPINVALDFIAGCMTPMIPAIIAGGLIKVLLVVFGPTLFGVIADTSDTYIILNAMGDAAFYFLPVLVAFTASKKLNCNSYLAVTVAAMLIYPNLITLLGSDLPTKLFGFIPVIHGSYASSVIPAMLSTILLKYVEILVDKITPEWSKNFLKPLLILFVTAVAALCLLAPIGLVIGEGLQFGLNWIYNLAPWAALALFAGFMPFIVMTGMHWAFVPAALIALGNPGYELMLIPAMLCSNIAQAGATFGVSIKTNDAKMRQIAIPSAISALLAGVTEPAMYGVTLKLKKPMYAACIAGGAAGFIAGLVNLKGYAFATPCLTAIVQFIGGDSNSNFIYACIIAGVSFIGSLVLSIIMTKNSPITEDDDTVDTTSNSDDLSIATPVIGKVVALSSVNDATFSSGVLGQGYAVVPSVGKVFAPFNGTVETLMDTHHAVGIVSDSGINMLVHVGLETVELNGKHFTPKVAEGDTFKKGDVLLEFDLDAIKKDGYDTTTPVIVSNVDDYSEISVADMSDATAGAEVLSLARA